MRVSTLLEEQECIIEWARTQKHINLCGLVYLLTLENPAYNHKNDELYIKAWHMYHKYNSYHKDNIIKALVMDCYRKENDFNENDIVTNGVYAGFAKDLDFHTRTFFLYSSLDDNSRFIRKFNIDDFSKVSK